MGRNGNNPIYPLLSTWITTWTEPEDKWDYFHRLFSFYFNLFFFDMKLLSREAPRLLVIQIQIQAVCKYSSVKNIRFPKDNKGAPLNRSQRQKKNQK